MVSPPGATFVQVVHLRKYLGSLAWIYGANPLLFACGAPCGEHKSEAPCFLMGLLEARNNKEPLKASLRTKESIF